MKNLFLFGYAPARKQAWPHGGKASDLEALDLRHGVAPNLVMTPILSAACHLPAAHQSAFLAYVRTHILEGDADGHHRRHNVLTRNVGNDQTARIRREVKVLFAPPKVGAVGRYDENRSLGIVFGYWAVTALFSYVIEGRQQWTKDDLKAFGKRLFTAAAQCTPNALKATLGFSSAVPVRDIPRLGICFRLCTQGGEAEVGAVLADMIGHLRSRAKLPDLGEPETRWVISLLRSLVPLPHNEVYQAYRPKTNPIGMYQACFMACEDPKQLTVDPKSRLLWQYVGTAIADRLQSTPHGSPPAGARV